MKNLKVLAVIPIRGKDAETDGEPIKLGSQPLVSYTIKAALNCSAVSRTLVTTDSAYVRELAIDLGAEAPFLRPSELVAQDVPLGKVFQHCVDWLEEHENYRPDVVLSLETSHPIRPAGLLEQVLETLESQRLDTVFTVYEERSAFWRIDQYGDVAPVGGEGATPRNQREILYREMAGLALACRVNLTEKGLRYGSRIGVVPIREAYALVDTQDAMGVVFAEHLLAQEL